MISHFMRGVLGAVWRSVFALMPGRGGGAERGMGGSVSRGSERLELVVEWTSRSVGCRIGAALIGCNQ